MKPTYYMEEALALRAIIYVTWKWPKGSGPGGDLGLDLWRAERMT